jgi:low affinity Fe/Cu permease
MLNIFEQPWTLLGVSIIALFVILTIRSVWSERRHWWQLLIPVAIAAAGFGLDFLVQTDLEKINALIDTGIKAVEEEDCNAIEAIIAGNYRDSFHNTKDDLMSHCRMQLTPGLVTKNKKRACLVELSPPTATATLFALITFEKDSYISREYNKPFMLVKVKLYLEKQPDKGWLISRVEVLEIDRLQVDWRQIR